ncbi:hypothetical protein JST97_35925 [bacterium]|nr:hypothetical protein [bacterium]
MSDRAVEVLQFGLGLIPFARPYQWNVDYFFGLADRVRLYSGGASGGNTLKGSKFLYEVSFPETRAIRKALQLDPLKASPRCLCLGSLAIEFWRGETHLTTMALHHHRTLRLSGLWPLDAVLRDGTGLARWLSEHGHPEELNDHLDQLRSRQESEEDTRIFYREAPHRLRDLARTEVPLSRLQARYPSHIELCQDLLRWFGCARRRWKTGLPPHEYKVVDSLKALGVETLVQATLRSAGDQKILRGAARYWTHHAKQADQLQLPDAQWLELQADRNNAIMLKQTCDRIRRKRLRLKPGVRSGLGAPRRIAGGGPYRNLVVAEEKVYALCDSRILNLTDGHEIFDCKHADVTFAISLGDFQIAQPLPGRVIGLGSKGNRIYERAEFQELPKIIPGNHSYLRAWSDGDLKIRGPMGLLLESPFPIRRAFLSDKWLFWSNDYEVRRMQLDPPESSQSLLARPACALVGIDDRLVCACPDGSLWLDEEQIATTTHRPLLVAADEDGIYILSERADGTWALEHPQSGVLADGLAPTSSPTLTLTFTHLYGAFGPDVLAFERLP